MSDKVRCDWPGESSLMIAYHDQEWGSPEFDDQRLFEFILLEGAQAGLSWTTILNKRENYRAAYDNFDFNKIAKYDDDKISHLLLDSGIVRNRMKIRASIKNAIATVEVIAEFGSLSAYIWSFVEGNPVDNQIKSRDDIPASTSISTVMSKDLKKRGFNFVGPTICYAFMQAAGLVNDHVVDCFRHSEVTQSSDYSHTEPIGTAPLSDPD